MTAMGWPRRGRCKEGPCDEIVKGTREAKGLRLPEKFHVWTKKEEPEPTEHNKVHQGGAQGCVLVGCVMNEVQVTQKFIFFSGDHSAP